MFALFSVLVLGTGAALHRERALFGESYGSTGLLSKVSEEVTFSVPFEVTGALNFAPDLPTARRNIAGRTGTAARASALPIATPPGDLSQTQLAGTQLAELAGDTASGVVIPLGAAQNSPAGSVGPSGSGIGSPFGSTGGTGGSGGGGSISTANPPPPPPPPPPPVSAVPEPATWAMMIFGFAFIGGTLRSRRIARSANRKAVAV